MASYAVMGRVVREVGVVVVLAVVMADAGVVGRLSCSAEVRWLGVGVCS